MHRKEGLERGKKQQHVMNGETYHELVVCGGLHQALDERMPTQNGEGDTVLRLAAELSENMDQVLEGSRCNHL